MINRKLLFLLFLAIPLRLVCAQEPPADEPAFDRTHFDHYINLSRQIGWHEDQRHHLSHYREETRDILNHLFSFAGYCGCIVGCYKLFGKIIPSSYPYLKGAAALLTGLWSGGGTSVAANELMNNFHLFGICHAIAHRFHPGVKHEKAELFNLYPQEAALRPQVHADIPQMLETVAHLQAQQEQWAQRLEKERQQYQAEKERAEHEAANDKQFQDALNAFTNSFERYLDCVYKKYGREQKVDANMDLLIKSFVHFLNLLQTEERPVGSGIRVMRLNQHSIEIIEHMLRLMDSVLYCRRNDDMLQSIRKINDAVAFNPEARAKLNDLLLRFNNYSNWYSHTWY